MILFTELNMILMCSLFEVVLLQTNMGNRNSWPPLRIRTQLLRRRNIVLVRILADIGFNRHFLLFLTFYHYGFLQAIVRIHF